MVKGGDQNRHGLQMVHAHIKLILKHPSPLITHACKGFFPFLSGLGAHIPKDPYRDDDPTNYPSDQELSPPCFSYSLGPNILVIVMVDLATVP